MTLIKVVLASFALLVARAATAADSATPSDTHFWLDWWVNVFVAAGTIGAVLVALFGDWIKYKLFSTQLELALTNPLGTRAPVRLLFEGQARLEGARYYHVRVSNPRRWPPATQVQVYLLQVEQPGPDGEWQTKWAGECPVQWSFSKIRPIAPTIGAAIDCDLCSVVKDKWVELSLLVTPSSMAELARQRLL